MTRAYRFLSAENGKGQADARREWLSRIDKDSKEARDRRIFEMWLACSTQEEIAEACSCSRDEVRGITEKFGEIGNLAENPKAAASHATDFDGAMKRVSGIKCLQNERHV